MMTVDRLISGLGPPQTLRDISDGGHRLAVVGRWRHDGAEVDLSGTDTVQVVFNVSGGQQVELLTRASSVRRAVRSGSVGIVMPQPRVQVAVRGRADTLQIILSRELMASAVAQPVSVSSRPAAIMRARLQAAAVRVMVHLAHGQPTDSGTLAGIVRQIAGWIVASAALPQRGFASGGLSPAARRRVNSLMNARLQPEWCDPLPVDELARAAGLSVHHFIKAFRRTEGSTPHAHLIGRRLDIALGLLLQANARVDRVAMQTGFSSPAHFVSAFRRQVGATPGALRDAAAVRG